jgi:hypothetical protein
MSETSALTSIHPAGEATEQALRASEPAALDTFAGKVFIRWDPDANVTGFGPAANFIEFLKTNSLWERWVEDCPLHYTSPNAPPKQDLLGTVMLSVLAGHKRYAHITTVRSDNVLPELLGMKRVRSEDAVRRAFQHGEEEPWTSWTRQHLAATYEPLLTEPWILDMDATVKPLYGQQEEAVVGYNPRKPGRPRRCITATSLRPFDWLWKWRCRQATALLRSMRSPGCGPGWMRARASSGRRCCEAILAGAPSA